MGAYNGDPADDLMNIDGSTVRVPENTYTASTTQQIYEQFGTKCKGDLGPALDWGGGVWV